MTGHYNPTIELFVFNCEPILSTNNRDVLSMTNPKCFKTTHKLNLQILDYNSTFHEFLGYNGTDFQEIFNLYRLLSPDSLDIVIKRHKDRIISIFLKINFIFFYIFIYSFACQKHTRLH